MIYTHHLIALAKIFDQVVSLDRNPDTNRFKVWINLVSFKSKTNPLRQPVTGNGFTIEDAAYDYILKVRGGLLVHTLTDQSQEVI